MEKPQYELTSYEPVSFKAPAFKVPDEAFDMEISNMAGSFAAYNPDPDIAADHVVEPGDNIKIALKAESGGKPLGQLSTDGRPYTVGEGYMPEGFDQQITGMKKGETKQFTFEGPDFDEDFNPTTVEVDATVEVLDFLRVEEPEIDDAWLQKNMPIYHSVDELRKDIAKRLEMQGRQQYDAYLQQLAVQAASERFEGHIPDEVYENARDNMVTMLRQNVEQEGKTWEDFIAEQGGEQQFVMMLMLQIRQMLVGGYVLDAIFRHEGLKVDEEDILEAVKAMAPGQDPAQVREQVEGQPGGKDALQESAERMKANKWLVETADITYVEPSEEGAQA